MVEQNPSKYHIKIDKDGILDKVAAGKTKKPKLSKIKFLKRLSEMPDVDGVPDRKHTVNGEILKDVVERKNIYPIWNDARSLLRKYGKTWEGDGIKKTITLRVKTRSWGLVINNIAVGVIQEGKSDLRYLTQFWVEGTTQHTPSLAKGISKCNLEKGREISKEEARKGEKILKKIRSRLSLAHFDSTH